MKTPYQEDAEVIKRFDDNFVLDSNRDRKSHKRLGLRGYSIGNIPAQDIKAFILSLRAADREAVRDVVEGMRAESMTVYSQGYNQALEDVISRLFNNN